MSKQNIYIDRLFSTLKRGKSLCITNSEKTYKRFDISQFDDSFFEKDNLIKKIVNKKTITIDHYFINSNLENILNKIFNYISKENIERNLRIIKFSDCIFTNLESDNNNYKNHKIKNRELAYSIKFERCVFQSKLTIEKCTLNNIDFNEVLFESGFKILSSTISQDLTLKSISSAGPLVFQDSNVKGKLNFSTLDFKLTSKNNSVKESNVEYQNNSLIKFISGNYKQIVLSNSKIINLSNNELLSIKISFKKTMIEQLDYNCWFKNKTILEFDDIYVSKIITFTVKSIQYHKNNKKNIIQPEIYFLGINTPKIVFSGVNNNNRNFISKMIQLYRLSFETIIDEIDFFVAMRERYINGKFRLKEIMSNKNKETERTSLERDYLIEYEEIKNDINRIYRIGAKTLNNLGKKNIADKLFILYNNYMYYMTIWKKCFKIKDYIKKPFVVLFCSLKRMTRLVSLYGTSYWTCLLSYIFTFIIYAIIYMVIDIIIGKENISFLNPLKYSLLWLVGNGNEVTGYYNTNIHFFLGILETITGLIFITNFITLLGDKIKEEK